MMKIGYKFLIYFWIFFAFLSVIYNIQKTFSEVYEWGYLSDEGKRHKIFGDFYTFLTLIEKHTDNKAKIIIFSKGGDKYQTFFLSIYYLYPRTTITTVNKNEFEHLLKTNYSEFVAIYDDTVSLENYKRVATFSAEMSTNYGALYKIK